MTKKLKNDFTSGVFSPRTDLACESRGAMMPDTPGTESSSEKICGLTVATLKIKDNRGMELCKRKIGTYVTLYCPLMKNLDIEESERITEALSQIIRSFTKKLSGRAITEKTRILVAGLGNRFITSDAVGPRVADKIAVTSHVMGSGILDALGCSSLSAIHPGVMGQTGIESASIIKGAAQSVMPDVIIAVDALAARSTDRLCSTIQLSDTGIDPGSGIGNRRLSINRETMGFPVLSIGIPTVVDSATLVYDALSASGTEGGPTLRNILSNEERFFVSPKDCDIICDTVSEVVAGSINRAFSTEGL